MKISDPYNPRGRDSVFIPKWASKQVVLSGRSEIWGYPSPKMHSLHFKDHIFANNSKTAGFRPFSSIFSPPPNPVLLPPSVLAMAKLLWKFQPPMTSGGRYSVFSPFLKWTRALKGRSRGPWKLPLVFCMGFCACTLAFMHVHLFLCVHTSCYACTLVSLHV